MNKIPNLITIYRIIFPLVLLLFRPLSPAFFIIYSLCGISDMADGLIARKMNWSSHFGAKLDTIADTVFLLVAGGILLRYLRFPNWLLWCAGIVLLIRLITYSFGFWRYRR